MTLNVHAIALWTGILGSAAAVYFPIHGDLKQARQDQTAQAVKRQQKLDALDQRLTRIESHLQLIDETLPEHDKQLAHRLFEQVQQQVQQATEARTKIEMVNPPVLAMRKMLPPQSDPADAPSVCASPGFHGCSDVEIMNRVKETPQ